MWGGSVAEALSFLAEGRGAGCNHPDATGCALPVLESPPCLTSRVSTRSLRLLGRAGFCECDSAQESRGAGRSRGRAEQPGDGGAAQWGGWEDGFQLARVLLAVLAACKHRPLLLSSTAAGSWQIQPPQARWKHQRSPPVSAPAPQLKPRCTYTEF